MGVNRARNIPARSTSARSLSRDELSDELASAFGRSLHQARARSGRTCFQLGTRLSPRRRRRFCVARKTGAPRVTNETPELE